MIEVQIAQNVKQNSSISNLTDGLKFCFVYRNIEKTLYKHRYHLFYLTAQSKSIYYKKNQA